MSGLATLIRDLSDADRLADEGVPEAREGWLDIALRRLRDETAAPDPEGVCAVFNSAP